jgi:hypothetical protein
MISYDLVTLTIFFFLTTNFLFVTGSCNIVVFISLSWLEYHSLFYLSCSPPIFFAVLFVDGCFQFEF